MFLLPSVSLCVGCMGDSDSESDFELQAVSQVLMELAQHVLQLWPMPPAVFPMSRSEPQSLLQVSDFAVVLKTYPEFVRVSFACMCQKGGTYFGKTPNKPKGVQYLGAGYSIVLGGVYSVGGVYPTAAHNKAVWY